MARRSGLDKILTRLDELDPTNLTILVQRLARERLLLETVFDTIREGILVIDRKGVIEYFNDASKEIIGLREEEAGKAILWRLVPELGQSLHLSPEGIYEGTSTVTRELEVSYPERRYIRLYLVPFDRPEPGERQAEPERAHYVVILSDRTKEIADTKQRIESEKVESIFMLAAGVAHELGNPLNSLTIHLQLINRQLDKLKDDKAKQKILKSVNICRTEVDRLDGIISHFLEAIRPTPPDLQELDLIAALEEVLEIIGAELGNAGVKMDVSISGQPPIVMADRNQIKQVYFNIFKNAKEAMEPGGEIRVKARSDDDYVYIIVGDTGRGIKPEDLRNIFQPYFTTKKSGHGLGMMIVQRIMNAHGGRIGVDSRERVGTVVTLQFPQRHKQVRLLKG